MKNLECKLALIISLVLLPLSAFSKTKIKDVALKQGNQGYAVIKLDGHLSGTPELKIRDRMIQVSIPNSTVWPKIEKKVSLGGQPFDSTLLAYQYNKQTSRFRIMLPYSIKGKEGQVSLTLRNGSVDVSFPKGVASKPVAYKPKKKAKTVAKKSSKTPQKYDESYLEKLLKDKAPEPIIVEKSAAKSFDPLAPKAAKVQDKVKTSLSGQKKENNGFSVMGYIGKFVAFLALVLLLFLGVIQIFKRGVFKKGKLGFLNSTNSVEVLSTTFLGPKRSLMMVRAHNQVFLLGSSEAGINLVSEIDDVTGLLKNGEKAIAGNNFDTSLDSANDGEKEFSLKEDITVSAPEEKKGTLADLLSGDNSPSDKVRFSDQIKNKVKNLKSLQ